MPLSGRANSEIHDNLLTGPSMANSLGDFDNQLGNYRATSMGASSDPDIKLTTNGNMVFGDSNVQ